MARDIIGGDGIGIQPVHAGIGLQKGLPITHHGIAGGGLQAQRFAVAVFDDAGVADGALQRVQTAVLRKTGGLRRRDAQPQGGLIHPALVVGGSHGRFRGQQQIQPALQPGAICHGQDHAFPVAAEQDGAVVSRRRFQSGTEALAVLGQQQRVPGVPGEKAQPRAGGGGLKGGRRDGPARSRQRPHGGQRHAVLGIGNDHTVHARFSTSARSSGTASRRVMRRRPCRASRRKSMPCSLA